MRKLRNIIVSLTLCLLGLGGTFIYAGPIELTFNANAQLNLDDNQQPTPTEITIYQLTTANKFNAGDFFSLYDHPEKYLGDSYITSDQLQILPNQRITRPLTLDPNTEYVAIVIAYSNLKKITWRKVIPIHDFDLYDMQINLGTDGLSLTQKKSMQYTIISGPYIEGSLGNNSLLVTGQPYSVVSFINNIPLVTDYDFAVKDFSVSPMLSLAGGYQWAMSTKDELGFLRIRSASLGGSLYMMNNLTLAANSTIISDGGAGRSSSIDQLSANLKALFIETKIGFLALDRFVPYMTLGLGVAQLDSLSYTQTIAQQNYTATEVNIKNIAFKAELGVDFYIYNHLVIGAGYQYMDAGSFKLQTLPITDNSATYSVEPEISLKINSILFKVRYIF